MSPQILNRNIKNLDFFAISMTTALNTREILNVLMHRETDITKDVLLRNGNRKGTNLTHQVFLWPKRMACKRGGEVLVEGSIGFTDTFKQLKPCLSDRNEHQLLQLHHSELLKAQKY